MSMTVPDQSIPSRPRLSLRCAESPGRVHRTRSPAGTSTPAICASTRSSAAQGLLLLLVHGWPQNLVPVPARHAGAGPGLRGHRRPPARHRAVRQAARLVLHRHPLRRPGRAHGFTGHQRFAMAGFDTGMFIAYALAADYLGPARPAGRRGGLRPGGALPRPPLFVPGPPNERLWHLAFNRLSMVNEDLVRGREDIFFGAEYAAWAGDNHCPTRSSSTTSTVGVLPTLKPCAAASSCTGRSTSTSRRARSARCGG